MSLVGRAVPENSFDSVRINTLRKMNVLELPSDIYSMICESLDSCSKWREVAALADGSRYALSTLKVEECAKASHRSLNASPTNSLLIVWGSDNMIAETLAIFLNTLKIERPLKYLKLPEELVITVQPESSVVAVEGGTLQLNCEATGFPYPVYEWFKEQTKIRTAVSNTGRLIVHDVTAAVAGFYVCRVYHTNHITSEVDVNFTSWSSVQFQAREPVSNRAIGGYGSVPVILQHPLSQTVRQYETLVLSCRAQSSSTMQYYWVRNGSLFSTGNQIQIALVDVTDAGEYYCIVKNQYGEIRSHSATITVNTDWCIQAPVKPQLLRQPVDLSVGIGGDAVFVVEAKFVNRLSYQWHHNDISVPNANGPELRFPVEDSSCQGTYQCVISSEGNSVLSRPAKLTVTPGNIVYKAADKLALLIGVSTYRSHGVPLPAVKNDLQETVKVLEEMQFKVVSLLDLTLNEMRTAVNMFCNLLSADVYTIFYCAGHGFIANNGRHYLIPCDAHRDVNPAECLCIESVQDRIQERKPKLMMFCLDICRRRISNDSEFQPLDLSTPNSVPNRIVLYAASEGQRSFEQKQNSSDNQRGLFNQYFLEVIPKAGRAIDLYRALIDRFQTSPYRTSPNFRDSFQQNPEMAINCEDYNRSLHDPLDTKCFQETINKQTKLWHLVHQLPPNLEIPFDIPLGNKVGKLSVLFSRITSNVMQINVVVDLPYGWDSEVFIDDGSIPLALRPVESRFDKSTSCTVFRLVNLQRLRENLQVRLHLALTSVRFHPLEYTLALGLDRPLIAYAYNNETPEYYAVPTSLLPDLQAERKEAMEHTEDHSLSSDT